MSRAEQRPAGLLSTAACHFPMAGPRELIHGWCESLIGGCRRQRSPLFAPTRRRGSDIRPGVPGRAPLSLPRASVIPAPKCGRKEAVAADSPTTAPHLKQKAASSGRAGSAQAVQGFGVRGDPS
jgi:hypothetical protein